jgi:signal transduction histidine kinase
MGAPLIAKGKLLGAAYVDTTRLAGVFDQTSLALFETFVQLTAVALENARLIEAEHEASARNLELQEYLSSVLQSQPYGLVIFNSDLLIEYVNPQAQNLLANGDLFPGCRLNEIRLPGPETMLGVLNHLEEFVRTGASGRYFWDSPKHSLAYSFFKVQNRGNKKGRIGLILEDITVQRQLEHRLIESEKRSTVNQLAGGIAHEINNSLQPVKGHVELLGMILERDGLLDGYGKEIETVGSLITRVEKIVKNLRHLSKPAKPEQEELDLVYLIRSTVEMLENTTGMLRGFVRNNPTARCRINLDLDESLPTIMGDRQGLEGMFINLILNSAHAIKEKNEGELTIHAHENGAGITLTFEDTGTGIKPDVLPHVFEPYFTTKEDGGTGLGMCIVQNVAEIHNAKLDLTSEYGKGTTITLTFPAMAKV